MARYIEKRRRRWYAVLDIPKDVQHIIGSRRFFHRLETESETLALRRAALLVARWKAEIDAARRGTDDPVRADVLFWQQSFSDDIGEAAELATRDALEEYAKKVEQRSPGQGSALYKQVLGYETGTLEHLDAWAATLEVEPKTKDMSKSDVRRLAARFPTLEQIARKEVRLWCDDLIQTEGLKPKTVTRILSAVRGYWRYLQTIEAAPEEAEPFSRLNLPKASKKKNTAEDRQPFDPTDVVRLAAEAEKLRDRTLADLIRLSMWTGARIEELCSLAIDKVGAGWFEVEDAKTEAGWRRVPIHSQLEETMARLVADSSDGYVLSGLTENKYGDRSNAVGKRFGRLKTSLGFRPHIHVFHSIRKTVVTIFENAGVPENVVADIIGHEKPSITYGVYSGGASLDTKKEAMERLAYPTTAQTHQRSH